MIHRIHRSRRAGFTLLEVVMVMAIISLMAAVSIFSFNSYHVGATLDVMVEQSLQGMQRAQLLAKAGYLDASWGYSFPAGTLYKGSSYGTRDAQYDEVSTVAPSIIVTGVQEVSYGRWSGSPSATGSVFLEGADGSRRTFSVLWERQTLPTTSGPKLTICHYPYGKPGNNQTIEIDASGWFSHRDGHGDTLGACP